MFAIHLKTKNDTSGNPRRLFLICNAHGPIASVPEGYDGTDAIRQAGFKNCPVVWDVQMVPGDYRRQQKMAPKGSEKRLAQMHKEYAQSYREHEAHLARRRR